LRHRLPFPALLLTVALGTGCAAQTPEPDVPAPASEPRARLGIEVDLPRAQRCEEAFDLALYQDHGIELIAWDDGSRCEGRKLTVRYLPGRTTPDAILRAVQATGAKVLRSTPIQGEPR
jgi:hypothetical protein